MATNRHTSLAGKIFSDDKVKWAINNFEPFQSAGEDGVFPALLQKGMEYSP